MGSVVVPGWVPGEEAVRLSADASKALSKHRKNGKAFELRIECGEYRV